MNGSQEKYGYIRGRLTSSRVMPFLSVFFTLLADVFTLGIFITVFQSNYILPIILLSASDFLILLGVLFANFRFRYSFSIPLLHFVFACLSVVLLFFVSESYFGGEVFIARAQTLIILFYLISVLSLTVSVLDASKILPHLRPAALIALVALVAASGYYTFSVLTYGYFGQGSSEYRTLIFTENETGYTANNALPGKGQTVVIPSEFNGKPITKVSCRLLSVSGVKKVMLNCDCTVEFELRDLDKEAVLSDLYVDRTQIDGMKEKMLAEGAAERDESKILFANTLTPGNLSENEVFLGFDYTLQSAVLADGNYFLTWVGNKNDTFSLQNYAEEKGIVYAENFNPNDEAYLAAGYNRNKTVLKALSIPNVGDLLSSFSVSSSVSHVAVEFQSVYRLSFADGNDGKYLLTQKEADATSFGTTGYRYYLASGAGKLLASVGNREGFNLSWKYTSAGKSGDLNDEKLLIAGSEDLVLNPYWALKPISVSLEQEKESYVYGDDVKLLSQVVAPLEDMALSYSWQLPGGGNIAGSELLISNALPSNSGNYRLTVSGSCESVTSLTATQTATLPLTVNKRQLGFTWTAEENAVYSGSNKTVSVAPVVSDIINGDSITCQALSFTHRNAGSYTDTVVLTGESQKLYSVKPSDVSYTFDISPYELTLTWGTVQWTYDGNSHRPAASAVGVGSDGILSLNYLTDYNVNAGDYTARVSLENGNYLLQNPTADYSILKKSVSLTWSTLREHEYDATEFAPDVVSANVIAADTSSFLSSVIYSAAAKDAGNYTVTASLPANSNYTVVANAECDYQITPRLLTVGSWNTSSFTYNGAPQAPAVASLNRILKEDRTNVLAALSYEGARTDAGNGVVTVSLPDTVQNYQLSGTLTHNFTVNKKSIILTWSSTALTYNGQAQLPTVADVSGGVGNDNAAIAESLQLSGAGQNAGNYTVTAALSAAFSGNYVISIGANQPFTVEKRGVTLTWESTSLIYNGSSQGHGILCVSGVVSGEETALLSLFNLTGYAVQAGTHTMTASLPDNCNYKIQTNATHGYTVGQKELTVTSWSSCTFTYDGQNHLPAVLAISGAVSGEEASVGASVQVSGAKKNAGNYMATASVSDTNYIVGNPTVSFTVESAVIGLVWSSETSFVYNGNAQHPVALSVTGAVAGEENSVLSSLIYTGQAISAGNYTCNAALPAASNYTVSAATENCAFSITPRTLGISSWGTTQLIYNGQLQAPAVTGLSNAVSGQEQSLLAALQYTGQITEVGNGTAVASLPASVTDYQLAGNVTTAFTVVKKSVSAVWDTTQLIYNGQAQLPAVSSLSGVVAGEEADVLQLLNVTGAGTDAGNYTATASLPTNCNYTLTNASYGYTIAKKEVTLQWDNPEFVYNKTTQLPTLSDVSGNVEDGENLLVSISVSGGQINAGSYTATATLPEGSNYTLGNPTCAFSIAPQGLTVAWPAERTFTANGGNVTLTAMLTGLCVGDSAGESYVYTQGGNPVAQTSLPGEYTVTVGIANGNYVLQGETSANFTVIPAPVNE